MDVIHLPSNDHGSDTELILSEPSSSPEQDATIQFSHQRFVPSDFLKPESGDHPEIAPFLTEEPFTSPSLIKRSLGLSKASFSSLTSSRQGSSSSILYPNRGGAESQILSDFYGQPLSDFSLREQGSSSDLRRGKMKKLTDILKKRSRGRLSSDTGSSSQIASFSSYASASTETFMNPFVPSPSPVLKKDKKEKGRQQKGRLPPNPPSPPLSPEKGYELMKIDLESIAHMEGIVNPSLSGQNIAPSNVSPSSTVDPSTASTSGSSYQQPPSPTLSTSFVFSNPHPFSSTSPTSKRKACIDFRKLSPKSLPPLVGPEELDMFGVTPYETPLWTAPESWAVENGEEADVGGDSSSEESTRDATSSFNSSGLSSKRKSRRKSNHPRKLSSRGSNDRVRVRIYRADGSYHVAPISIHSTVAELTPSLNQKLFAHKERETHKLYLKERGRERVLAPTERPAAIVIRRLEQAGYDQADNMTFLMKFVYKSQLLGPAAEDLTFDTFDLVDLTGCSLPTIPIVLHQNAGSIIPLDFIQSCTTLRDLKLSSMAMKKVPQSVRHSTSLHRLDLSCNRIVDLDDAGLDRIPELSSLRLQNNRIEQLPWYFPRLKFLNFLNISNNKFVNLPCLVELDMSFNMITELPEEIGRLVTLERLILIGNQVVRLPEECRNLVNLQLLDCRRNNICDISIAYALPKLQTLYADHNSVHALHLSIGPSLSVLDASHNDITFLKFAPSSPPQTSLTLTQLDVSYAKLSSLDAFDFSQLPALHTLKLDHNELRTLPDSLGELSISYTFPRLETLDAHNNSLTELPVSLWNCASLIHINVTSNLLASWHDPPGDNLIAPAPSGITLEIPSSSSASHTPRKPSNATYTMSIHNAPGRPLPPLAYSLERLSIGENRLTEEAIPPFTILKELRVLNLSFNEIQELPSSFLRNLQQLEELYLSGNQLTSIPTEDLVKMTRLSVLFLNGNKFQTLPAELGKIPSLTIIDAGSNLLRYNIHNWEFDWNWNFNCNLKYLNLSGNKKLDLKQNNDGKRVVDERGRVLSDFSRLSQLRVLGLMDVMTTFLPNIPEDSDERRVRTSQTEVNGMSYGIADTIGRNGYLTTLDLVLPEFRGKKDEALFAMFGRTKALPGNNTLSKYLHDNYASVFTEQLLQLKKDQKGERRDGVPDAMRRTFLKLNRQLHDKLYSQLSRKMSQVSASTTGPSGPDSSHLRQGASGIVVYVVGRTLYVANVGHALAVISSQGNAELISRNHDPYDRDEARRIRLAEGWISPTGLIHNEVNTSRAFGYFHDFPVVNARPDIYVRQLTELDEFVIIGNRGLWQYISYQTAVDIARSEADPMIAAQKLRDFAISYGADGNTMIMVICVSDLFRSRQPITDSLVDPEVYSSINKKRAGKKADIVDRTIARLEGEVSPPTGHLCLVFTDIRNSTQLWEANAGMPTAMRIHNNLLRRHLRTCGGYVVKTEGDAFMWCLIVQLQLLREPWPLEILECPEGKEVYDEHGQLLARGLSVRMGVHCGTPVYEPDPITGRMDYFGPMVIRAARISGLALGGQIMCSADVVRELNAKIFENGQDTEYSEFQPTQAIEAIRQMQIALVPAGEVKLKGLEIPEIVSLVYPAALLGRQDLDASGSHLSTSTSTARVQLSIAQVRDLAMLCLRIEALTSGRIFRPCPEQKEWVPDIPLEPPSDEDVLESSVMYGDPNLLLPPMNEKTSDLEIMMHLDSLSLRLENAVACLALKKLSDQSSAIVTALEGHEGIDERTLHLITSLLSRC
ncbi:hypothetical protein DFJ58DRAFT_904002 [Suillus subalutaceus]|uniref:uncharacterized protein n=1 Tax=Suillus subalutaceus TaxID=48586 RepID=UPI001B85CF20|nr:uncharacterized protein DFJ58DRAFT_904002 [Suillus subalutaceus]KAG1871333.1 hypothetical protein DFJ58DRAFT_904002 [Suillus subalutaceus]